ncbi:GIY-YIG nuclease family protein [Kaistella palustris]|uniref:GIY-YIG nuclease family protein n=1 Tax=Kaistella palustris TaxID=493376 RepID=UPI0004066520|nr:GIY-YIG nuclease family protein [Kaistella palustris]
MNEIEKEFFTIHKIDFENCIDVQKMRLTVGVKAIMKYHKKKFAYNTFPCKRGHTIKNSVGQCVMCNSSAISYHSRERNSGYLYIAGSKWGERIKIGATTNYEKREKYLNENKGYGMHADWKILAVIKVDEMGFRERQIHNLLEKYREYGIQYYRGNEIKTSNEAFRCNYEKSLNLLKKFCLDHKFDLKIFEREVTKYDFANLIKDIEDL